MSAASMKKGFYGTFLNGFSSGICFLAGLDRMGDSELLYGGFLISVSVLIAVFTYRDAP